MDLLCIPFVYLSSYFFSSYVCIYLWLLCTLHILIPHRPHRVDQVPTRRHCLQRLTTLRSKPAPVRHLKYCMEHQGSTERVRRAFPGHYASFPASPRAAPIICADAGLRSKPSPSNASRTRRDRSQHHAAGLPGFERVAPSAKGSGLVCGGGVCGEGGMDGTRLRSGDSHTDFNMCGPTSI
jgi:hypothetical protein